MCSAPVAFERHLSAHGRGCKKRSVRYLDWYVWLVSSEIRAHTCFNLVYYACVYTRVTVYTVRTWTSMSVFWPLQLPVRPMRPALTSSYQFPGVCTPHFIAQAPPHISTLPTAGGGLTESGHGAVCGHFRPSNASHHDRVVNRRGSSLMGEFRLLFPEVN